MASLYVTILLVCVINNPSVAVSRSWVSSSILMVFISVTNVQFELHAFYAFKFPAAVSEGSNLPRVFSILSPLFLGLLGRIVCACNCLFGSIRTIHLQA